MTGLTFQVASAISSGTALIYWIARDLCAWSACDLVDVPAWPYSKSDTIRST